MKVVMVSLAKTTGAAACPLSAPWDKHPFLHLASNYIRGLLERTPYK
jgi:hypothetical protein